MAEALPRLALRTASIAVPALAAVMAFPRAALPPETVLAWAALLAAGQLVRVPAPSGRRFTLGLAVSAALLLTMRGLDGSPDAAGIVAAYGLGLLGSWVIRLVFGEGVDEVVGYTVRRSVGLSVLLGAYLGLEGMLEPVLRALGTAGEAEAFFHLSALLLAGGLWYATETFLNAVMAPSELGSLRYHWLEALGDWMVVVSLFATGALFGFAWPRIGLWSTLVAGLPYGFSHLAFLRAFDTRRTYRQTIQALSRIPEVAGLSPEGHGQRVGELAVTIARDLGLSPAEIAELELAALLHDIGRITLNEPSILKMGFTDEDIARWGAEIVAEAPYLARVARLVREQHHPYRRPGEERDLELPIQSKIIRAASAFDHATNDLGFPVLEALELLHRGAAYDFDPAVVQSLRRIVERQGVLSRR